jgi:transketolase
VFTRQGVPVLSDDPSAAEGLHRGAYVIDDCEGEPDGILLATGSEVSLAVEAAKELRASGAKVRIVSMPCWERFAEQEQSYRDQVLPPAVRKRVSVEAGVTLGWERWIGFEGRAVGVDRFGASAPAGELLSQFGLTVEKIVAAYRSL